MSTDDPLGQAVADLIRVGVSAVVEPDRGPRLVYDPKNLRADALVRRCRPLLAERRDDALALFARLSLEVEPEAAPPPPPDPVREFRCRACRALCYLGGGITPADVWRHCRRGAGDGGVWKWEWGPQCPWQPKHSEVPVPIEGWPEERGRR